MDETVKLHMEARDMLRATSRTFFIPIDRLPTGLQEEVTSAYLCMRAIDEIEDHPQLPSEVKISVLHSLSQILKKPFNEAKLKDIFEPYKSILPEVTLRLGDWISLSSSSVTPKILSATSTMSEGMASWVRKDWQIKNREDLDQYTYYVAGLVGELLTDIWEWYDNSETDKELAVAYGRGLQSVNILRNQAEDLTRGVSFFPDGWEFADMLKYARRNLELADIYTKSIKSEPILDFCKIPLALAQATLNALESGQEKLSRNDVNDIVNQLGEKQVRI
jgi:farnesyl-diphosphate farnesyltransferase